MKKCFAIMAVMMATSFVGATELDWAASVGVPAYGGADPTGWVLALYQDGGNDTIDWIGAGGASLGDDTLFTQVTITADNLDTGTTPTTIYWYNVVEVTAGIDVFSAIFNSTDISTADHAVNYGVGGNVDGLYTVPAAPSPPAPTLFDPGSPIVSQPITDSDGWYPLVPEPGSTCLMLLGLATLAVRRVRRSK